MVWIIFLLTQMAKHDSFELLLAPSTVYPLSLCVIVGRGVTALIPATMITVMGRLQLQLPVGNLAGGSRRA